MLTVRMTQLLGYAYLRPVCDSPCSLWNVWCVCRSGRRWAGG